MKLGDAFEVARREDARANLPCPVLVLPVADECGHEVLRRAEGGYWCQECGAVVA